MLAQAIRNIFGAATVTDRGPLSDFWYTPAVQPSASGVSVTDGTAMAVPAWWGCVRVLTDAVGSLPLHVYRRQGDDRKERDRANPWYRTFHDQPNGWQTPLLFKSIIAWHFLMRGVFYGRIDQATAYQEGPRVVPLNPDRMKTPYLDKIGNLIFEYTYPTGKSEKFNQGEVLYALRWSLDGFTPCSPLTYARETLGRASSEHVYASSMFGGGGFIKYYLTTKKKLGKEGRENFRQGWRNLHGDPRRFEPPILEDDMEIKTLGMSNADAQFLESRKMSGIEICQFLGVPPHLIFLLDRATWNNIESQGTDFLTYGLNPHLVCIEQAANQVIDNGTGDTFCEFSRDAITRADITARYNAHKIALGGKPFKTLNEVRVAENLEPIAGGDEIAEPEPPRPPGGPPEETPDEEAKPEQETEPQEIESTRRQPEVLAESPAPYTTVSQSAAPQFDLHPLIADVADRIVAREVVGLNARIDKAKINPQGYFAWAVEWSEKHRDYVAKAVQPLATATHASIDAGAFAASYCDSSVQEFASREPAVVLKEWSQTKAGRLAAELEKALCSPCTNT